MPGAASGRVTVRKVRSSDAPMLRAASSNSRSTAAKAAEALGDPDVDLAGVIGPFVSRPVGVGDDDLKIGRVEGEVVIPAVPDDHVGLGLRPLEDVRDRLRGPVGERLRVRGVVGRRGGAGSYVGQP